MNPILPLQFKQLASPGIVPKLYNRHEFTKAMDAEILRQHRYGGLFSVALVDLDDFKGLNDTMGREAGDAALKLLADTLLELTRQTDTVAWLGVDEFVVLMPDTTAVDCDALCHLVCDQIKLRMVEALSYPITASIGYTTVENSVGT